MLSDLFNARDVLKVGKNEFVIYRLDVLERAGLAQLAKLPFSIRIMLEGVLRQCNGRGIIFTVKALLNTTIEVNYYRNGGILQSVFRHLMSPHRMDKPNT